MEPARQTPVTHLLHCALWRVLHGLLPQGETAEGHTPKPSSRGRTGESSPERKLRLGGHLCPRFCETMLTCPRAKSGSHP